VGVEEEEKEEKEEEKEEEDDQVSIWKTRIVEEADWRLDLELMWSRAVELES
jgi:hypothetical protein